MSLLTLTLACAPLLAQDGAESTSALPAVDDGWRDFDGVAMIVNDDIVTLRELDRLLKDARGQAETTTPEDADSLLATVAENAITERLWIQAGARIGIPDDSVEQTITRFLADTRRNKSPQETADWMASSGAGDLGEFRENTRDQLYRTFWIQSVRGEATGGLRAAEDRFVRPGQLQEAYRVNKQNLSAPPTVIFQFLALSAAAWGDAETAREALEGMREDILAGGDMGALVDEYGSALRDTRGISQRVPLSAVDDPQLLAFAQSAEEGSLSELLPLTGPGGEVQGYQIARIVSRTSGQAAPDFEDPDLQVRIAERLQQTWDNKRIQVGSEQLWRSAFIRHPPALAVRPPWDRR